MAHTKEMARGLVSKNCVAGVVCWVRVWGIKVVKIVRVVRKLVIFFCKI